MITLNIEVPESRDRTAISVLKRGTKMLAQGFAAASASPQIAAARGNAGCDPLRAWGHPPTGGYRLINHRPSNKDYSGEYGMHLLLFEPVSGAALEAQAAGRVGLLVYGGPAGQDKFMRRTQGGVRISNEMLNALIRQIAHDDDVRLTLESLRKPPWWKFWARTTDTPMLSATAARAYPAPLDEMSIILELMNGARRRSYGGGGSDDYRERERDDSRYDDRSSSGSSSGSDTFRGGGGQSGGGGASGGWDGATGTARGVDASGRIIAGAAVGAAAMIAANAAAGTTDRDGDGVSQLTDGGSSGDGGSDNDSTGISASDTGSDTSNSASTSTGTSY